MRAIVALAALGASACVIDELDASGKQCPCAAGFVCDESRNVCVESLGTGGTGGGPTTGGSADPGVVQPSNLRADWTTPNVILWRWDRGADDQPDQLAGYELVIGTSEDDVTGRSGSAQVFDDSVNPELGRYLLPHTGAEDPVEMTMTDGLDPDTVYFAQLVAIDTASRTGGTNVAQGRTTLAPVDGVVIFDETDMPGYSLPNEFQRASNCGYEGGFCYQYVSTLCGAGEECWENLRRQDVTIDVSGLGSGAFTTSAYFEIAVANGGTLPGFWSEVWLQFQNNDLAQFTGWTIRNGDYRVYQFPLRALLVNAMPLEHAMLQSQALSGFNVGAGWEGTATIRVDEVAIRW